MLCNHLRYIKNQLFLLLNKFCSSLILEMRLLRKELQFYPKTCDLNHSCICPKRTWLSETKIKKRKICIILCSTMNQNTFNLLKDLVNKQFKNIHFAEVWHHLLADWRVHCWAHPLPPGMQALFLGSSRWMPICLQQLTCCLPLSEEFGLFECLWSDTDKITTELDIFQSI